MRRRKKRTEEKQINREREEGWREGCEKTSLWAPLSPTSLELL